MNGSYIQDKITTIDNMDLTKDGGNGDHQHRLPGSIAKIRKRSRTTDRTHQLQQSYTNDNFLASDDYDRRVILLLDLDCFYAQCECVRLGFDASTTPLALLQWNSVLAVTYPARNLYQIKRGDTWEEVYKKSNKGQCYAVHVPVLTTQAATSAAISGSETATISTPSTSSSSLPENKNLSQPKSTKLHNPYSSCSTSSRKRIEKLGSPCTTTKESAANAKNASALSQEYPSIFQLSSEERERVKREELGVRRFSSQGKACIERYRIASTAIFDAVREWIQESSSAATAAATSNTDADTESHASPNVVLERASIDEFFLDVTSFCYNSKARHSLFQKEEKEKENNKEDAFQRTKTIIVSEALKKKGNHSSSDFQDYDDQVDPDHIGAIHCGCFIAYSIRERIREKLGFKLSAGISYNKTVAKLSASYGKPNGQAVTYPGRDAVVLLQQTEIGKCRNLGGKLGSKVQALLPPNVPTTVGSIAKYLSLVELQQGIMSADSLGDNSNNSNSKMGDSTLLAAAQFVWDLSHGKDAEVVEAKTETEALVKSITAFKSIGPKPHTLDQCVEWIRLLAVEIVTRVESDAARHRRYPRGCTVQYKPWSRIPETGRSRYQNKSIRTSFPPERLSTQEKVRELIEVVPKLIRTKEGQITRITRVGLCAVDFVNRSENAIISYFSSKPCKVSAIKRGAECGQNSNSLSDRQLPQMYSPSDSKKEQLVSTTQLKRKIDAIDTDLELAKRLQKTYDGENRIVQALVKAEFKQTRIDRSNHGSTGQQTRLSMETVVAMAQKQKQTAKSNEVTSKIREQQLDMDPKDKVKNNQVVVVDKDGADMELAKRLQAGYDREFHEFQKYDQSRRGLPILSGSKSITKKRSQQDAPEQSKTRRIDAFFQKR